MKRNTLRLPPVPNAPKRTGDEFAMECEKWEEASDEDDDYPYKDWVASLARRTLQPPISSARDLASRTWLTEKEEIQKLQWQESFRKERPFLPAVTMPASTAQPQGMHLLGASRRLKQQKVVTRHGGQRWRFVGKARCMEAQAVKAEGSAETDEYVPEGWGNLKDYVHGVKIGPGSLFSHPWDRPTPSGIHPNTPRVRKQFARHTLY
ncbi:unnamed protein product [Symbiodinium natans]|uniref:Uncharacterized protein n=1 Tax=Symbiodinium natans TaxID=878477 RepID=A0A812JF98_9DINO|nr:unnamed protein product [Symbiodinium natans]